MKKRKINRANFLLIPLIIIFIIFFIIPFLILAYYSFLTKTGSQVIPTKPYTIAAYAKFFSNPYYLRVVGRTIWLSFITAAICALLGYPVAYFIAHTKGYLKSVLLVVVILPLVSGLVVQTLGLYGLMSSYGPINNFLMAIGLIKEPIKMLGTMGGVTAGLVQGFIPYMILPIITSIQSIPGNVLEAADNLGANGFQKFIHVTLPLSRGGILSGSILVFGCTLNSYATPLSLGQGKIPVIGTAIYQQAMQSFNWPFASAMAMLLIVLVLVVFVIGTAVTGRSQK